MFRTYLVITRLLARGIGVARISRKSKKEVPHHRYRLIFNYVCLVVLLFLIILNRFLFAKVAGDDTHTHCCHFYEWIDTWITRRAQQYMEWLKKVDEDVRNCERAKTDRAGRYKGTGRE